MACVASEASRRGFENQGFGFGGLIGTRTKGLSKGLGFRVELKLCFSSAQ